MSRSRTWRVVKYVGAVSSVLLAAALIVSGWVAVLYSKPPRILIVDHGMVEYWYVGATPNPLWPPSPGWHVQRHAACSLSWLPRYHRFMDGDLFVRLPIWIPLALIAALTTRRWWRDWRYIPPGQCQKCGYNLTGNVSGRCPECGTPVKPSQGRANE